MAINVIKGKYPHIGWVDLEGQGTLTEIAIVKNGATGLYFIRLNMIDAIDKQRLFRVITNRNSHLYELWDLMSNITLGNGANALEYFHQYVKVLTPAGQVETPRMGRMGFTGVRKAPQQVLAEEAPPPAQKTTTTRRRTTKKSSDSQPAAE